MYCGAAMAYGKTCSAYGKQALVKTDERPPTYGTGRLCAIEGCQTVLSRYNPSAICSLHSLGWKIRQRSPTRHPQKRPERIANCQNPNCSGEFVTTNPARKFCSDPCRMQAYQLRMTADRRP